VLDKAARSASVDIVIDMKSVDTGYATFNEHIQAETSSIPPATDATFKSTKVTLQATARSRSTAT